jgi:hypothetical protein
MRTTSLREITKKQEMKSRDSSIWKFIPFVMSDYIGRAFKRRDPDPSGITAGIPGWQKLAYGMHSYRLQL